MTDTDTVPFRIFVNGRFSFVLYARTADEAIASAKEEQATWGAYEIKAYPANSATD